MKRRTVGRGAAIHTHRKRGPLGEFAKILFHPSSTDLDFWLGATEPRSSGRGAGKHRKVGNEGGDVFFLILDCETAGGGAGGRDTPTGRGGPEEEVAKIFTPLVINLP